MQIQTYWQQVKPNFKTLGKKLGKSMKAAVPVISNLEADKLAVLESGNDLSVEIAGNILHIS